MHHTAYNKYAAEVIIKYFAEQNFSMDKKKQKADIDFSSNLSDELENKLEKSKSYKIWSFR